MTKPNLIAEEWEGFKRATLDPRASDAQVRDMRRSFYGGALSLLTSVMGILDPESEVTDNDVAQMEAISKELDTFAKRVVEGKE